jgi:hypothetical protein
MIRKYKISGVVSDKDFAGLPLPERLHQVSLIEIFKRTAKSVHISQKRRSHAAAWRAFKELYKPTQWHVRYNDSPGCRDDSFEVHYI